MAAGATYEPIATQTLASAAASITFSSIAATYTDLRLVWIGSGVGGAGAELRLRFNGLTTGYSDTYIQGNGSAASSNRYTSYTYIRTSVDVPTTMAMAEIDIFSYAGSTYKTCLMNFSADINGAGGYKECVVGLSQSTTAITSVQIYSGANFNIGTIATLYGIKAA